MQAIRYKQDYFDIASSGVSKIRFPAGSCHPVSEEGERHVALHYAELVDVPDDVAAAAKAADKALDAANKAQTKAVTALKAADAAAQLADAGQQSIEDQAGVQTPEQPAEADAAIDAANADAATTDTTVQQ